MTHFITIKGQQMGFTTEEARALYEELEKVFERREFAHPFQVTPTQPIYHSPDKRDTFVHYPNFSMAL